MKQTGVSLYIRSETSVSLYRKGAG